MQMRPRIFFDCVCTTADEIQLLRLRSLSGNGIANILRGFGFIYVIRFDVVRYGFSKAVTQIPNKRSFIDLHITFCKISPSTKFLENVAYVT